MLAEWEQVAPAPGTIGHHSLGAHLDTLLLHLLHFRTSGRGGDFRDGLRNGRGVSCVESVVIRGPIFVKVSKHEALEGPDGNVDRERCSPEPNTNGLPRHPKSKNQTLLLFHFL